MIEQPVIWILKAANSNLSISDFLLFLGMPYKETIIQDSLFQFFMNILSSFPPDRNNEI